MGVVEIFLPMIDILIQEKEGPEGSGRKTSDFTLNAIKSIILEWDSEGCQPIPF